MKVVCHHEPLGSEGFQTQLTQWCAQREQWEGETLCRGEQEGNREREKERERERPCVEHQRKEERYSTTVSLTEQSCPP